MQQISSKQLKCYGRRNRAKPETTTSSLESGPPAVRDVRGAPSVSEEVQAPAAASVPSVEGVVGQAEKRHAGRGRPRKVVGGPKPGTKSPGDVGNKNVPTTRSSAVRLLAPEGREVVRDSAPVEESVSEGSTLKTTPGPPPAPAQPQPQPQPQERVPVRVRIVGPFSNGGSNHHGRSKSLGSASPGSQKTRGQIARQEARRAADEETRGDGVQGGRGRAGEVEVVREGNGEWQPNEERGSAGNGNRESLDAGEPVVVEAEQGPPVSEKRAGGKHHRRERRIAGEQVVERRDDGRAAMDSRAGGGGSQGERDDAVGQTVEEREEGLGGKSHRERRDSGDEGMGRRHGGPSIAEKSVAGKPHRVRRDGGHSGGEREGVALQGTLASRRRLLALQRRQREDAVLSEADDVLLKHEYLEANKDKKGLPKSKEPIRPKTHWDFVIEEMTWLAKDFERERKWKLSQAKKVSLRVNRSKLDVVARENRRLKEEEQRMRRVASNIAKDVKKFWLKVDKLVSYKQQLLVEERKKKALDKHLDFLLGQTERYSTMLAENLGDPASAQEREGVFLLPPVPAKGTLPVDGGVASDPVAGGVDLEGSVGMEIEGGADADFMVEDGEELEDDEATLEADEALITEAERKEELSALQRESELPLEDLLNAYKLMRGDAVSESEDEASEEASEEESGEAGGDEGSVGDEESSEGAGGPVPADVPVSDESKKHPASTPEGSGADLPDARAVGGTITAEGRSGSDLGGHVVFVDSSSPIAVAKEVTPGVGVGVAAGGLSRSEASVSRVDEGDSGEAGLGVPVVVGRGPYGGGAVEAGVESTKLVVELSHRNFGGLGRSLREVKLEERSHVSPSKSLDERGVELQDDTDYVPGALADGSDEADDERTLEEEERLAREEGDGGANEIDALNLESEMPLEELLAQYRSGMDDGGEESDDFSEDRRDRTSEAGTSGSGSGEDEDDVDEDARYSSDVRERMGEPSTSGRDYRVASSSGVIDTAEVKEEIVEAKFSSPGVGASGKMDVHGRVLHSSSHPLRRNGLSGAASSKDSVSSTGLLLGGWDQVDAETAAAVAKVSEAARRRGDRILMRSSAAGMRFREVGVASESMAVSKTGDSSAGEARGDQVSPAALPVGVDGDVVGVCIPRPSSDGVVANGGVSVESVDGVSLEAVAGDILDLRVGDKSADAKVVGVVEASTAAVSEEKKSEDRLADFAAAAQSAQPTGYTFSTTKVKTKLPFLLKHSLREYQHIGLDWLVTMYEKRLNGILADEMGLGKTIMTIALLAHLACEKGIWGPHLIVVPTSVMLNWETEFMKWCPAFKILTYFGSAKERKVKRQGWSRGNSFHVCITTYRLVIQDAKAFKRKKWKYLILDEAHLIKNWKSQRWQTLLTFNSKRRILLTGTPLQNDLMELWSLMHFLMPHVFQSHQEFRDWFSNPISGMVEGADQVNKELVDRLHNVLRPFLLRRLKKDVEKQLPGKFEHVIRCRLSKRQRNLYEDFMASSDTQATLSSGNFLGLINVLMQLRKVCNHPDLFEGRPIVSSFDMPGIEFQLSSAACSALCRGPLEGVGLEALNLQFGGLDGTMSRWEAEEVSKIKTPGPLIVELASTGEDSWKAPASRQKASREVRSVIDEIQWALRDERERRRRERVLALWAVNELRCGQHPVYGSDVLRSVEVLHPVYDVHRVEGHPSQYLEFSSILSEMVQLPPTRCERVMDLVTAFMFAIPAARAPVPVAWCSHAIAGVPVLSGSVSEDALQEASRLLVPLRPVVVRRQLFFPDRRLLQFDCGKLQELAVLLRRLKSEGHRALIFTQMTKMLDVLESFINLYGYTYMRLDGSTKPEQRQILMQRFNTNPKIFLFILSTRSGGVGINLVGADTVIFYDSDWNPAMDLQAQDRCHRIGQTREVHIYRLISESTIEENILKKANQKRILDDLVIQSGSYNTDFFKKLDPMELFSGLKGVKVGVSSDKISGPGRAAGSASSGAGSPDEASAKAFEAKELSSAEVEAALKNAEDEADYMAMKRVEQEEAAENQEFTEELVAGNLDDEDLADDLDENGRSARPASDVALVGGPAAGDRVTEDGGALVGTEDLPFGESSLLPTDADEEMDMLADVRQMAAAAAASGRGSVSFEDQLRPVERYAMRFLEVWDPRVDNLAVVAQVAFEEKEWELDQLEKLKEEQEAEIDEDNEPLFYETWDTAFADEAYRQQVDILAQQQEQKQLEWEAMEAEMRDADRALAAAAATVRGAENFGPKSRGKKKLKKAKFKSLTEGSLMSDTEEENMGEDYQLDRGGDPSYRDEQSELLGLPHRSPSQRKRKAPRLLEEELSAEKHSKKLKKDPLGKGRARTLEASLFRTIFGISSDPKSSVGGEASSVGHGGVGASIGKDKGGKLIIFGLPAKKGPLVMLEKERKKDSLRSVDHLPAASAWTHGEDAVLCAVVHEYGGNWQLASDALAGVPDGGVYRGRYRHPIHCRERFRQLLAQNAAAASGDPTSEKSALSAATNAQLKVTEEHTKRLLDAVLQLPDQELLLQRHFVAVLAAVKSAGKVGFRQDPDLAGSSGGPHAPGGRGFVALRSLVKSHVASSKVVAGKLSPREVSAALAQADGERRVVSKAAASRAHAKESVSKDPLVVAESEGFSVTQFLVGSAEYGEPSALDGERVIPVHRAPAAMGLEDWLGLGSGSSPPSRLLSEAVRKLADMLVENRFRFAARIGWDGGTRDWAAAGGSGTGVLGLHIPSKGRVAGKKRPAPDPSKPPKAKLAKTSKADVKKGHAGSPAGEPVENGEDSDVFRTREGDANGKERDSEGASSRRNPSLSGKVVVKRPKKSVANSALPASPPVSGRLDLNQQADPAVVGAEVSRNAKKVGASGGSAAGAAAAQRLQEKSSAKSAQSGPATSSGPGSGRRAVSGHAGGTPSPAGRESKGVSGGNHDRIGRGIDLNGSSDDDVTIVGVSAGSRLASDASESPVSGPVRRLKIARDWTKRTNAAERGSLEEASFVASKSSGPGYGGVVLDEDSSLASHLMTRLAGSSAADLLSPVASEGLSPVQWPPAAAGAGPLASLNEDLDFTADLSFLESGRPKSSGVGGPPSRSSPPGQGAGRILGRGGASPAVGRLQSSDVPSRRGVSEQDQRGPTPAWMLGPQARRVPESHGPAAGGIDLSRPVLRLGPSSPVRPAAASGASALHQAHTRAHSSPSRGGMAGVRGRPGPLGGQRASEAGAFPGQPLASPESPVDTGLGLSLGSGSRHRGRGRQVGD